MHRRVRYFLAAVLFLGFVRTAFLSPVEVLTSSMVPTLTVGDHVLVNRMAYGLNVPSVALRRGMSMSAFTAREILDWATPGRGEVVLFENPIEPGVYYVKRVVGVSGDTVELVEGSLFVNGIARERGMQVGLSWKDGDCEGVSGFIQPEGTTEHRYWVADIAGRAANETFGPVIVPEQNLFVLGDNRDESADSRVWGVVPRNAIRGRVMKTWLSTDECVGTVNFTWRSLHSPSLLFSDLVAL